jgi:hypothetical protein
MKTAVNRLVAALVLVGLSGVLDAGQASNRRVRNAHEIYRELAIDPASVGRIHI